MNVEKIPSIYNKFKKINKIKRIDHCSYSISPLNSSKYSEDTTFNITKLPHIIISNNLELEPLSTNFTKNKSHCEKMLEKKRISLKKTHHKIKNDNEFEKKFFLKVGRDLDKTNTNISLKSFYNEIKTLESKKEIENKARSTKNVTNSVTSFSIEEKSKENTKKFVVFSKLEGTIKSSENLNKEHKKKIRFGISEENKIMLLKGNNSFFPSVSKSHETVIFPSELKSFKYFSSSPKNAIIVEGSKINNFENSLKEKNERQMKFVISEKERHKKEYYRSNFGINLLE